jgi:hypothetical protein
MTVSPRLFVLTNVIELLASAWEPYEAVPVEVRERLDLVLSTQMRLILSEEDEGAAMSLAASMREDVSLILRQSW